MKEQEAIQGRWKLEIAGLTDHIIRDLDPNLLKGYYRITGDRLELCIGLSNTFPEGFSDAQGKVTLVRDRRPVLETERLLINDEVLGELRWEDDFNWFAGEISHDGISISISLNPEEESMTNVFLQATRKEKRDPMSKSLLRAKDVCQRIEHYIELAKTYAVEELLSLKNHEWRKEDEALITTEEFKKRMTLTSMGFDSDGFVEFYHRDGGLFRGHSIQIRIDAHDKCVLADIPG